MNDQTTDPTDPNNVIPPNELEHRRRVLACIDDLAGLSGVASDRIRELREMGVPATDWMPILVNHGSPVVQSLYATYGSFLAGAVDGFLDARAAGAQSPLEGMMAGLAGHATRSFRSPIGEAAEKGPPEPLDPNDPAFFSFEGARMKRLIERLFAEAPKLTDGKGNPDPTQAPAVQCQVLLKAGGQIQGALSVTPEGTLRMMGPNMIGQKPVMAEHFFDYEQVADIVLLREVKTEGSRIVTS